MQRERQNRNVGLCHIESASFPGTTKLFDAIENLDKGELTQRSIDRELTCGEPTARMRLAVLVRADECVRPYIACGNAFLATAH
jgi:hypothetical protein